MALKRGSAAARRHLARVAALGCIVCRRQGLGPTPAVVHHIKDGCTGIGRRAPDDETIPLCHPHHDGGQWGVAFHAGPEEWERRYGTQREMLAEVMAELEREP